MSKVYTGGTDESANLVNTLYSDEEQTITCTSNNNMMYIVFETDSSVTGAGFNATYVMINECSGRVYNLYHYISFNCLFIQHKNHN